MKKFNHICFCFVLFLFVSPGALFSQDDFWNEPAAFTDSVSDNKNQMYVSENNQQAPFSPKFYSGAFFVKNREFGPGYTTFIYRNNDTVDIYTSDFYGLNPPFNHYQDVSKSDNTVKHPQFFTGRFENP